MEPVRSEGRIATRCSPAPISSDPTATVPALDAGCWLCLHCFRLGPGSGVRRWFLPIMPVFYDCQRCTACCRWPGQVKLSEAEIARLARFQGLSEFDFIQRYTRLRADRQGLALQDKPNGECIFLEHGACAVQAVKPQQCRDFPHRWNFPGFEQVCRAIPREVSQAEFERLLGGEAPAPPES